MMPNHMMPNHNNWLMGYIYNVYIHTYINIGKFGNCFAVEKTSNVYLLVFYLF